MASLTQRDGCWLVTDHTEEGGFHTYTVIDVGTDGLRMGEGGDGSLVFEGDGIRQTSSLRKVAQRKLLDAQSLDITWTHINSHEVTGNKATLGRMREAYAKSHPEGAVEPTGTAPVPVKATAKEEEPKGTDATEEAPTASAEPSPPERVEPDQATGSPTEPSAGKQQETPRRQDKQTAISPTPSAPSSPPSPPAPGEAPVPLRLSPESLRLISESGMTKSRAMRVLQTVEADGSVAQGFFTKDNPLLRTYREREKTWKVVRLVLIGATIAVMPLCIITVPIILLSLLRTSSSGSHLADQERQHLVNATNRAILTRGIACLVEQDGEGYLFIDQQDSWNRLCRVIKLTDSDVSVSYDPSAPAGLVFEGTDMWELRPSPLLTKQILRPNGVYVERYDYLPASALGAFSLQRPEDEETARKAYKVADFFSPSLTSLFEEVGTTSTPDERGIEEGEERTKADIPAPVADSSLASDLPDLPSDAMLAKAAGTERATGQQAPRVPVRRDPAVPTPKPSFSLEPGHPECVVPLRLSDETLRLVRESDRKEDGTMSIVTELSVDPQSVTGFFSKDNPFLKSYRDIEMMWRIVRWAALLASLLVPFCLGIAIPLFIWSFVQTSHDPGISDEEHETLLAKTGNSVLSKGVACLVQQDGEAYLIIDRMDDWCRECRAIKLTDSDVTVSYDTRYPERVVFTGTDIWLISPSPLQFHATLGAGASVKQVAHARIVYLPVEHLEGLRLRFETQGSCQERTSYAIADFFDPPMRSLFTEDDLSGLSVEDPFAGDGEGWDGDGMTI